MLWNNETILKTEKQLKVYFLRHGKMKKDKKSSNYDKM